MNPTAELLNEIWSGARTGLTSLRALLDVTDDTNLRNEMYRQETEYQGVVREAENLLAGQNERPEGVPCVTRACTWTGIRMNTLTDRTTPHLAGMLIQGNTMGVIELTRARADLDDADPSAHDLAARLIALEQDNIERSLALLEQAERLTTA